MAVWDNWIRLSFQDRWWSKSSGNMPEFVSALESRKAPHPRNTCDLLIKSLLIQTTKPLLFQQDRSYFKLITKIKVSHVLQWCQNISFNFAWCILKIMSFLSKTCTQKLCTGLLWWIGSALTCAAESVWGWHPTDGPPVCLISSSWSKVS